MNLHEVFEKESNKAKRKALEYYKNDDMENYFIYAGVSAGILRAEFIETAVRYELKELLEMLDMEEI